MFGGGVFDSKNIFQKLETLKPQVESDKLWDDQEKAKNLLIEYNELKNEAEQWETVSKTFKDLEALIENETDQEMLIMLNEEALALKAKVEKIYIETLFSDKDDKANCFLTVHAGSGGQESEDWARMLWEMYLKFANLHYTVNILDENYTTDGNIKSATMKISSKERKFPFGWFKSEVGVHRLVRISPYDKKKQRHTSFASVATTPEVTDDTPIEIDEKDIRLDTYRASGAGGQHVNKTDSAIRITHMPTGIVVQCQNDRSQHKNKAEAFKMLKSKLYEKKMNDLKKERDLKDSEKKEITWGSQIRSYVKHPYQMVKDNRTSFEIANFDKVVFEAEIENFMIEYLKLNVG